jgi:hypothetical protein
VIKAFGRDSTATRTQFSALEPRRALRLRDKKSKLYGVWPGGEKGLWGSRIGPDDSKLVIAETAIDAMNYFALKGPPRARYVSTAGILNSVQPDLILAAINKLRPPQSW